MSIEESYSKAPVETSKAKSKVNRLERQKRLVEQTIDAVLPD